MLLCNRLNTHRTNPTLLPLPSRQAGEEAKERRVSCIWRVPAPSIFSLAIEKSRGVTTPILQNPLFAACVFAAPANAIPAAQLLMGAAPLFIKESLGLCQVRKRNTVRTVGSSYIVTLCQIAPVLPRRLGEDDAVGRLQHSPIPSSCGPRGAIGLVWFGTSGGARQTLTNPVRHRRWASFQGSGNLCLASHSRPGRHDSFI